LWRVVLRKVVLKLSGKVFNSKDFKSVMQIAKYIEEFIASGGRIAVVTGGGSLARDYIDLAREAGVNKSWQDVIGIIASRMNAFLLGSILSRYTYFPIPSSVEEFLQGWSTGKVVIMGGLQPGQSTNAVSAAIAELIQADLLINATVVDGVYDKDPNIYSDAKLLRRVDVAELRKYLHQAYMPGKYELLDPVALSIIERSRLRVIILNARKPEKVLKALRGNLTVGTLIN